MSPKLNNLRGVADKVCMQISSLSILYVHRKTRATAIKFIAKLVSELRKKGFLRQELQGCDTKEKQMTKSDMGSKDD